MGDGFHGANKRFCFFQQLVAFLKLSTVPVFTCQTCSRWS